MAWPPGTHIETLITQARRLLTDCRIVRHDVGLHRALIDLEGKWRDYRVIISEIHRADNSIRYAYYVLDNNNQLIYGFDNSPDILAIKQKYGPEWKSHIHEEVPHQHDANRQMILTPNPMTFEVFIEWLGGHLK